MGASFTEQIGTGKTPAEAFRRAVSDADAEYGHQEGYSGAINSGGGGFVLVALPARFTYRKFQALLEEYEYTALEVEESKRSIADYRPGGFYNSTGTKRGWKGALAKAERTHKQAVAKRERLLRNVPQEIASRLDGLTERYTDKWGDFLAVELKGAELKSYGRYVTKRRGEKVYVFFGYAPS